MILIENIEGLFYSRELLEDGRTKESAPFDKDSDKYKELIAEGCKVELIPQAEKAAHAAQQASEQKQTGIDSVYNNTIKAMVGNTPQSEIDTWATQKEEAVAFDADSNADVPFIQSLANERGMLLSDLVPRILGKAAAYRDASSKALGQKHASEDALAVLGMPI
jgi:hypothetical protein